MVTKEEFKATIGPKLATYVQKEMSAQLLDTSGVGHTSKAGVQNAVVWANVMKELGTARVEPAPRTGRSGGGGGAYVYNSSNRGYSGRGYSGGGRGGGGCFAAGTQVLMEDGSTVAIEELRAGDDTAGGRISATLQFDRASAAPLYTFKGVTVTGDHAVLQGEAFVRVRDADGAVRLPSKPQIGAADPTRFPALNCPESFGKPGCRLIAGAPKPAVIYDVISSAHRIVRHHALRSLLVAGI